VTAIVDLHLHTTASDGRCSPEALVDRCAEVGLRAISVTDHDTRAAETAARAHAAKRGLEFVAGIEITSVHGGKDVHVLGYNLPAETPALNVLIAEQRRLRVERAREIAERLLRLGAPIDIDSLVATAAQASGKAVARPQIAQYLIAAGHAASVADAFDRFLGEHCSAYVPHQGASPATVVALIADAGGVASLAHPGRLGRDELIPDLVHAGLECIEAYHSSHDEAAQAHYLDLARRHGLLVTGGSDYHGDGTRHADRFGVVGLEPAAWERFRERLDGSSRAHRTAAAGP
jgi:predicted metal-dependent phosphoesterase TrpH